MKKKKCLLLIMLIAALLGFQSCDNDGYSIGDVGRDWATVRVLSGDTYYLEADSWGKLWPAATAYWNYKPLDGQRVITYFNPLSDRSGDYDHDVKVEYLYNILTKEVEDLTATNEESYGNDPVLIFKDDMWISAGYLNIVFQQNRPTTKKHRVSLVRNTTIEYPNDGYIYLEYRYNTYDDLSGRNKPGAVSFNLNSLPIDEGVKGIKVKLNSQKNGEVEVTLNLKAMPTPQNMQNIAGADELSSNLQ